MSDEVWTRAEIESPCVKVCVIHPEARICAGCHRTIEEIGGWSRMTSEERRRIMGELPAEQTSPSQQVIRLERAEQFADVIMRLFKDEYTAVLLKHVHDRKFDQMAEHLGRSPEAVAGLLGEA